MLGPEEGEDRKLEVVRLALQQLLDTGVLPVREAELAVEWLFRDGAQDVSLAPASEGDVGLAATCDRNAVAVEPMDRCVAHLTGGCRRRVYAR